MARNRCTRHYAPQGPPGRDEADLALAVPDLPPCKPPAGCRVRQVRSGKAMMPFIRRSHMGRAPIDPRVRFWATVEKTETCWLWIGSKNRGYGAFNPTHGSSVRAHRYAYELLVGPIPDGLTLDHLCRVRACVNPAHLEPVTRGENVRLGEPATKTTCLRGHPYDEANGRRYPGTGRRYCNACARERMARRRAQERTGVSL